MMTKRPIQLNTFFLIVYFFAILAIVATLYVVSLETERLGPAHELILSANGYGDSGVVGFWAKIFHRIQVQPFNLIALTIFALAVCHTFFSHKLAILSNWIVKERGGESFFTESLHFLSEVEVVFGFWVIPLILSMTLTYGWSTTLYYLNGRDYAEPMFVAVIMALAATKPVYKVAEKCVRAIASFGGGSVKAWWISILTLGPILGSLITEPGAITLSALLLSKQVYRHKPSLKFAYATLGLLFVNISVGGVLTCFAAPPVLMVTKAWHWTTPFMMSAFGWKALTGIVLSNLAYIVYFWREFEEIDQRQVHEEVSEDPTPFWVSLVHLTLMAWIVLHVHYPVIYIGSFVLFLGFYSATQKYQFDLDLKTPVLVGFFLAGLVVHGGLQAWWISPLLEGASETVLMLASTVLTSFNDNATITYLATLVPGFTDTMKYAVMAGAVTGGGLTVIANAPNPAGQAILSHHFPDGISPMNLFLGALVPTAIVGTIFFLFF